MAHVSHFNPAEARDPHGRWTRLGGIARQIAKTGAAGEAKAYSPEDSYDLVKNIATDKKITINGNGVANIKKGYRVTIPGVGTQHYQDPRDAAVAAFLGQHHTPGDPSIKLPGAGAEPPHIPGAPIPEPEKKLLPPGMTIVRGPSGEAKFAVLDGKTIGHMRTTGDGSWDAWVHHAGTRGMKYVYLGEYPTPEDAAIAIHRRFTWVPAKPKVENPEDLFRRGIETTPTPAGRFFGKPPSITITAKMSQASQREARMNLMTAASMTSEHDGDVSVYPVTVSRSPHGYKTGRTYGAFGTSPASHYQQALQVHAKIFEPGADAILARNHIQKEYGPGLPGYSWWVPVDDKYPLGVFTSTHEYGHAVHQQMMDNGHMNANKFNDGMSKSADETEFWNQLSDALGVVPPQIPSSLISTGYGLPNEAAKNYRDVHRWFNNSSVQKAIKTDVSEYGARNMNEMLAELWTEYNLNSHPREPAKVWGHFVESKMAPERFPESVKQFQNPYHLGTAM